MAQVALLLGHMASVGLLDPPFSPSSGPSPSLETLVIMGFADSAYARFNTLVRLPHGVVAMCFFLYFFLSFFPSVVQMVQLNDGQPPPCTPLRLKPAAALQACTGQLRHCAQHLREVARQCVQRRCSFVFRPRWDAAFASCFHQA